MDSLDTSAMASLASYADESDSDDERPGGDFAVDNISDEDTDSKPPSRSSSRPILDENLLQSSQSSTVVQRKPAKKTTRLVSYGPDEHEEDEDEEDASEPDSDENGEQGILVEGIQVSSSLNAEQASSLSRSVQNKSFDEIELPSEPPGKCSKHLQDKIARLYDKMREGVNLSASIQNRKDFRNPSIYEKLIEYCGIDEKGTNYPPEIFDPHCWGKESFYDALEKAQKADMEKREKEKKERTKVEFVTEEKKRKTKWDAQPGTLQQVTMAKAISQNLVMAAATGTKTTVIPAVGNITKKPVK